MYSRYALIVLCRAATGGHTPGQSREGFEPIWMGKRNTLWMHPAGSIRRAPG